jgi:hypothetical protein
MQLYAPAVAVQQTPGSDSNTRLYLQFVLIG